MSFAAARAARPGTIATLHIVVLTLVVPVAAGCAGGSIGRAQVEPRTISGQAVDVDGAGLDGLAVHAFPIDADDLRPGMAMASTTTGSDGAFALRVRHDGDVLLAVQGDAGTGRVRIAADEVTTLFTYPVRTEIWLLHDNDHHFTFNYMEPFLEELERHRADHTNVFLLNAGDFFVRHRDRWHQPFEPHYYRRAVGMIALMNALAYDVATPGNHEFDFYGDYTRKALEYAAFPLIAANAEVTTAPLPQFEDYVVLHTDNRLAIAVLGLSRGGGMDGVHLRDPIVTALGYRHLAEDHDVLVALTHIGYRTDRELAEAMPELDVIIGGHSHTLLEEAELINGVLVAQAGGHPHPMDYEAPNFPGIVRLLLESGRVVEKEGRVLVFAGDGGEEPSDADAAAGQEAAR